MKYLQYANFELDNNKHSIKKYTIETYFYFKDKYAVDSESDIFNEILDEYARNLPLKFILVMNKTNNLEVR